MFTDIYLKHDGDPGYDETSIIESEEFNLILAQVKMVLLTPKHSVLGDTAFGIDEDRFLFDFSNSFDLTSLENSIRFQLREYCSLLKNRNWDAKAYIVPDELDPNRDCVHVVISLDKKPRFVIAYS